MSFVINPSHLSVDQIRDVYIPDGDIVVGGGKPTTMEEFVHKTKMAGYPGIPINYGLPPYRPELSLDDIEMEYTKQLQHATEVEMYLESGDYIGKVSLDKMVRENIIAKEKLFLLKYRLEELRNGLAE